MATASKDTEHEGDTHAGELRTGSDAIVDTLKKSGVDLVIGYSGGGTMMLADSIVKGGLKTMAARTEMSAAWVSYGYNRIKRRASSAVVSHVVGVLHTAPMLMAAKSDSTPLLVIDINSSNALDMREGLQDGLDVYSVMRPMTKYIRRITTAEDMPLAVRQAVTAASTGRPGPAVLDIQFNALIQGTSCKSQELSLPLPPGAAPQAIEQMVAKIKAAKQPVLVVGAGVHLSDAAGELRALAERLNIPVVCTTWGGRGVLPDTHPLFAGVLGSFGWESANEVIQRADLWLAFGTTFSQVSTGAWTIAKPDEVVHVDIDPQELGKIFEPSLGVVGDAKIVMQQVLDAFDGDSWTRTDDGDRSWVRLMEDARSEWHAYHKSLGAEGGKPINQYFLIDQMNKKLPEDTLIVADSGFHAYMLYRSFEYQNSTQMAQGSRYQSLGAGLPISIGAKLAAPERTVVCYHGDGGFFYDFGELATLAQYNIKVIVIVDHNGCLLANRAGMRMMGFENPWVDLPEVDFVALAKSMGVDGEQVVDAGDFSAALDRALASEGSYIIDVVTDPDTRLRRAIKDVVPILTDRKPSPGVEKHVAPGLEDAWPH